MKKKVLILGTLAFTLVFACKPDDPKPEDEKVEIQTTPVKNYGIIPENSVSLVSLSHYKGNVEDNIKGFITMQIGYDDDVFLAGSNTLWNATQNLYLPHKGTEVGFTNSPLISIFYDKAKFNKAFILVTVNIYNSNDWQDQGVDDVDVSAESRKVATYKIYLRSIANTESLTNPWSSPANGTFSLKIDLPEAATYSNHCTDRNKFSGACKSWANKYYIRQASTIEAKFAMNVQRP